MTGPAPKGTQVRDFVKNWRRKNPKDSMAPLIALCDGRLYRPARSRDTSGHRNGDLCDSQPNSQRGYRTSVTISEMAPHRIPCELG
ncbi:hypothetical protein GQ600_18935 [Phytophthora cactorum]|nr:hypothetical protein GQ600_18935 [Phytophthora cactorum]